MWPLSSNDCGRHHFEEHELKSYRILTHGCSYFVERKVVKKCAHEGCDEQQREWRDVAQGEMATSMRDEAGKMLDEFLDKVKQ